MEILFFAVFVKASPQDEHGVERPALSQGCGGSAPPHHSVRAEPCTLRILTDAFTGAHGRNGE